MSTFLIEKQLSRTSLQDYWRIRVSDPVNNPAHYGGADNPYEAIKVIDAWRLSFCLGNVVKYIARAGKKNERIEDLKKARWYLDHEIKLL